MSGATAWLLVIATSVGAGVLVGAAATSTSTPAELQPVVRRGTIPVRLTDFDDARQTSLRVTAQDQPAVHAGADGVLTESQCRPGGTLTSGQVIAHLNGQPVLALATSTPLWRPLSPGLSGPDVDAVRRELGRLGGGSGPLDPLASLRELARRLGTSPAAAVPIDHVAWLPAPRVTVGTCPAAVGAALAPGAPLATLTPEVTRVGLAAVPTDAVQGARSLTVGATTVPVDAAGQVTDPTSLVALSREGALRLSTDPDSRTPAQGTWRMRRPISAARLPASALVEDGARVCVAGPDGKPHAVTVVSSVLGASVVQFAADAPSSVQAAPDSGLRCG